MHGMAYRLHIQIRTILITSYNSGLLLAACGMVATGQGAEGRTAVATGACGMVTLQDEPVQIIASGDVAQGRQAIQDYGGFVYHAVPGMRSTGGIERKPDRANV